MIATLLLSVSHTTFEHDFLVLREKLVCIFISPGSLLNKPQKSVHCFDLIEVSLEFKLWTPKLDLQVLVHNQTKLT